MKNLKFLMLLIGILTIPNVLAQYPLKLVSNNVDLTHACSVYELNLTQLTQNLQNNWLKYYYMFNYLKTLNISKVKIVHGKLNSLELYVALNSTYTVKEPEYGTTYANITCENSWKPVGNQYLCELYATNQTSGVYKDCVKIYSVNTTNDTCEYSYYGVVGYKNVTKWKWKWIKFLTKKGKDVTIDISVEDLYNLVTQTFKTKYIRFKVCGDYQPVLTKKGWSVSIDHIPSFMSEDYSNFTWWNSSWQYRRPITISEQSGNTLTDYQVKLTIDTASLISSGKMNSDCSDIRFTDSNDNQIPYYIESGCNSDNTIVWVKVPEIPASSTATIYMYYGNTEANSESNADNVFILYDDFSTFDSSKWTTPTDDSYRGWDNNNGYLHAYMGYYGKSPGCCMGNGIRTQNYYDLRNSIIEAYFNLHHDNNYANYDTDKAKSLSGIRIFGYDSSDSTTNSRGCGKIEEKGSTPMYQFAVANHNDNSIIYATDRSWDGSATGFKLWTVYLTQSKIYYSGQDNSYSYTETYSFQNLDHVKFYIGVSGCGPCNQRGEIYIDWVRVRKYTDPEPTYNVGSEESNQPPPTIVIISPQNKTYRNTNVYANFTVTDDYSSIFHIKAYINNQLIYDNSSYHNNTEIYIDLSSYINGHTTNNFTVWANDTDTESPGVSTKSVIFTIYTGWYSSSWKYRTPINITEQSGNTLTDYQVKLTIDTASLISEGKMNSDCSDIRFTYYDGSTEQEIPYWIESGCNSDNTIVWVKVPEIPANGQATVYMYYGNSEAESESSVSATFIREIDGAQPVKGSWHFDEGSGTTAYDSSGNGNDGTLYNGPQWVDGKFGKALSFDGSNDYVKVPRVVQDDFTITFWVKTTQTASTSSQWWGGNGLVDAEVCGATNDFGTALVGSKAAFGIGNPDTTITASTDINDGKWHYIVAVRVKSTGEMKLYVDGNLEATGTGNTNSLTAPSWIGIGNNPCDVSNNRKWFDGTIDEVHIYNRALSEEEISDLYNYYGYTTTNYPGRVLVRKYTDPEPTYTIGSEEISNQPPSVSTPKIFNSTSETNFIPIGQKMTIRVNVTDPDGASDLDKVLITIIDNQSNVVVNNETMTQLTSITNGYTYEYNYTTQNNQPTGIWQIKVYANDTKNAWDYSFTTLKVNGPPSVSLISPVDNGITVESRPYFTFKSTDDMSATLSCTLYINDIAYGDVTATNDTETTIQANSSLSEGDYSWYVECTDDNGATGQSETRTIGIGPNFHRCGTLIDEDVIYYLDGDIIDSGASTCIDITTNNVTLDCQGHTIDGVDSSSSHGIYLEENVDDVTIENCVISDWSWGVSGSTINVGEGIKLHNLTAFSNYYAGIYLLTHYSVIDSCKIYDNSIYGIKIGCHSNITNSYIYNNGGSTNIRGGIEVMFNDNYIYNNNIYNNNPYGIVIEDTYNHIYNNILNNSNNVYMDSSYVNYWNTTKQLGNNIFDPNNPYIGGNYWTNPSGTGYSDTCADVDHDGFCDEPYEIDSNNYDYLPLTKRIIDTTPPTITFISQTPSNIYENTTSPVSIIINITDDHSLIDLNKTAFFQGVNHTLTSSFYHYNWTWRYPANDLQPDMRRAENRNMSYWFENVVFKENPDDIWTFAGYDNTTKPFEIIDDSTTYTTINITFCTAHRLFPQIFPVDKRYLNGEDKTGQYVEISRRQWLKIRWYPSMLYNYTTQNYTIYLGINAENYNAILRPFIIYFCNSSYTTGDPENSDNCVYFNQIGIDQTRDIVMNQSKYVEVYGYIGNGYIADVKVTNTSYFVFKTDEFNPNRYYQLWYADDQINQYINFTAFNNAWYTTDSGSTWTMVDYTPDFYILTTQKERDKLMYYVYTCDVAGNCVNSSIQYDSIDPVNHPPVPPLVIHPNETENITGLYTIEFTTSGDPDFDLFNASIYLLDENETYVDTLADNNITCNNSVSKYFYTFNTSKYPTGKYQLNVTLCDTHGACSSYKTDYNFTIYHVNTAEVNSSLNVISNISSITRYVRSFVNLPSVLVSLSRNIKMKFELYLNNSVFSGISKLINITRTNIDTLYATPSVSRTKIMTRTSDIPLLVYTNMLKNLNMVKHNFNELLVSYTISRTSNSTRKSQSQITILDEIFRNVYVSRSFSTLPIITDFAYAMVRPTIYQNITVSLNMSRTLIIMRSIKEYVDAVIDFVAELPTKIAYVLKAPPYVHFQFLSNTYNLIFILVAVLFLIAVSTYYVWKHKEEFWENPFKKYENEE